ncbi:MAG: D-alanyl-D-alanine carboxypeptidase family protein [Desulfitobacteriaceae bacterium]
MLGLRPRQVVLGIILCVGILLSGLYMFRFILAKRIIVSSNNSPSEHSTDLRSKTPIKPDESYYLVNLETNEVLLAHYEEMQRAPASTTKLLTGLVALKLLKEDDLVIVGQEVNLIGTSLGLHPGDQITVRNLLTAVYLASANDAAAALAVKASGSISAFSKAMNIEAQSLGCLNSHYTTPHGLPDPAHYTTAKDLENIAWAFIKNKSLMKYVQQTKAIVEWKDAYGHLRTQQIRNTNKLLGVYPGTQGLKTGKTDEAGQCLISYDIRPDGKLLLVVLGSDQRYRDTINLLDEGWAKLRTQAALKTLSTDPRPFFVGPGIFVH